MPIFKYNNPIILNGKRLDNCVEFYVEFRVNDVVRARIVEYETPFGAYKFKDGENGIVTSKIERREIIESLNIPNFISTFNFRTDNCCSDCGVLLSDEDRLEFTDICSGCSFSNLSDNLI